MHISKSVMAPVDISQKQCSRAWSLLRTLAGQFSDETCDFEGDGSDALEIIYTAMDLIAEASEAAGNACENALDKVAPSGNPLVARE